MSWVQYSPLYNGHAKALWERTREWDFDSSHEISEVDNDGNRRKVATFTHSDDAHLVEKLVNAYQRGEIYIKEKKE